MRVIISDDWFMVESGKDMSIHTGDKNCLCDECCLEFMLDNQE